MLLLIFASAAGCGGPTEADIKRVLKEMQSPDPAVRNHAALEAADYQSAAPKVVPALIRLLNDPNNGVRSGAAYALRRIGTPAAEKALEQATKDEL